MVVLRIIVVQRVKSLAGGPVPSRSDFAELATMPGVRSRSAASLAAHLTSLADQVEQEMLKRKPENGGDS
jgi:hypothetical protein